MPTTWDIGAAAYESNFLDTSDVGTNQPSAVHFKPDGTKVYIGGQPSQVGQYTLGTPWDLSTASFDGEWDTSAHISRPWGVFWRDDGTSVYIIDDNLFTGKTIYQFTTTLAWSFAGVNFSSPAGAIGINSYGVPRDAHGLWIDADGINTFFVSTDAPRVWRKQMSTPWDVDTLALVPPGTEGDFTLLGTPQGCFVSPDGTQLLVIRQESDLVLSYTFGTPFLPSSLVLDADSLDFSAQNIIAPDLYVAPDGVDKLFLVHSFGGVYGYSLPPAPPPG